MVLMVFRHGLRVSESVPKYRDIVMVAGTDPYAYKGTEEIVEPFLRLDRGTTRVQTGRER